MFFKEAGIPSASAKKWVFQDRNHYYNCMYNNVYVYTVKATLFLSTELSLPLCLRFYIGMGRRKGLETIDTISRTVGM